MKPHLLPKAPNNRKSKQAGKTKLHNIAHTTPQLEMLPKVEYPIIPRYLFPHAPSRLISSFPHLPRPHKLPPSPKPRPTPILAITAQIPILMDIPALPLRPESFFFLAAHGRFARGGLRFLPFSLALALEFHFAVDEGWERFGWIGCG